MPAEKFTTFLTPFECKAFHTGKNAKQQPFTIYQVRARNDEGQEITQFPLRSFEPLKLHERIEVEAKLYDGGPNYGASYTLKPIQSAKQTNGQRIETLEKMVEYLTVQLASVAKQANATVPTYEAWSGAQPAPQQQQTPPPAAPAPTQQQAPPPPQPPPPAPGPPPPVVQPQPPVPAAGSQFGDDAPF